MNVIKQELRWEMANICVDHHAKDGLKQGTHVRILPDGNKTFSQANPLWGKS